MANPWGAWEETRRTGWAARDSAGTSPPRSGVGRAFYCFLVGERIVVLHAFIKKSRETPDREIMLARSRLKELQDA